MSVNDKTTN